MAQWLLDDICWADFNASKLDPELVRIVKAAALVEYNGGAYAHHLYRIFADDPGFQQDALAWGDDEIQHGLALGRWAQLADPDFDFAACFARFNDMFRIDFDCERSRRGSRGGEMVARCIVETATSCYYQALRDAAREPVLRQICHNIAADEVRHYKLFYRTLMRYRDRDKIGFSQRLRVVVGRLAEARDDELACAYHAANKAALPYDRQRCARAYTSATFAVCHERHVTRAVRMIFHTLGLATDSGLSRLTARLAWMAVRARTGRFTRAAV